MTDLVERKYPLYEVFYDINVAFSLGKDCSIVYFRRMQLFDNLISETDAS